MAGKGRFLGRWFGGWQSRKGADLAHYVGDQAPDLRKLLDIALQVCWGMEYAHEQGLMHLDLKPLNVMLTSNGVAKVTDFGLARALGAAGETGGTPDYMAPEQWADRPTTQSDVYAFGGMLYEIVSGRRPFEVRDVHDPEEYQRRLYEAHAEQTPPLPRDVSRRKIPNRLSALILQCLSKREADRPQGFGQLARELEEMFEPLGRRALHTRPNAEQTTRETALRRARMLVRLGIGCYRRGDLDHALQRYKEAQEVFERHDDRDDLRASLGNQGLILRAWGRLEEAMALHKEEEAICRELDERAGLQASLGSQAEILEEWARFDQAMALYKEKVSICRELGDPNGLAFSLGSQAWILGWKLSRPREALPLAQEALRIATEAGLTSLADRIFRIVVEIEGKEDGSEISIFRSE